jgi:hypothetical protein
MSLDIEMVTMEKVQLFSNADEAILNIKNNIQTDVTLFFDNMNWWLATIHIIILLKSFVIVPLWLLIRLNRIIRQRKNRTFSIRRKRSKAKAMTRTAKLILIMKFLALFIPLCGQLLCFAVERGMDRMLSIVHDHANVTYHVSSSFEFGLDYNSSNPLLNQIKKVLLKFGINRQFNLTVNPMDCMPKPMPLSSIGLLFAVLSLYRCIVFLTSWANWAKKFEKKIIDFFYPLDRGNQFRRKRKNSDTYASPPPKRYR